MIQLFKKIVLNGFGIGCILPVGLGFSSQLTEPLTTEGLPFVSIDNPAYIVYQTGIPIGAELTFDKENQASLVSGGFNQTFENNGYAVYYAHDFQSLHEMSIGYGSWFHERFSGGLGAHLWMLRNEPFFSFDIGGSMLFGHRKYFSAALFNLLPSDTTQERFIPGCLLSTGGALDRGGHVAYTLNARVRVYDFSLREFGYEAEGKVVGTLFENPNATLYVQGGVTRDRLGELAFECGGGLGTFFTFYRWRFGVQCGYIYDPHLGEGSLIASLYSNPLSIPFSKLYPVTIAIAFDSLAFNPFSVGDRTDLLMSLTTHQTSKTTLSKWSVIITRERGAIEEMIKTFSGGGIPPSTIAWNGRDGSGTLCPAGEYRIRFIAVDSYRRLVSTPTYCVTLVE